MFNFKTRNMRRQYIPRMGPKKPVSRPVNYVKSRPSFDWFLKEWHKGHKEYYTSFKARIEKGILDDDPKTGEELIEILSADPSFKGKDMKQIGKDIMAGPIKRLDEYEWDKKKDIVNWVSNDLDATLAEHISPFSPSSIDGYKKLFTDSPDDRFFAIMYWSRFDDGQILMLMALNRAMDKKNITSKERLHGEFLTRGVVEKGVITGCFHKNYWERIFNWDGFASLKKRVAAVLSTTKGKGGRNAEVLLLDDIITGPDKKAILANINNVVTSRKKDTDLACLLMLLVKTGNVDKDIKYKPFHDALKSQFPNVGIGTERRPQQLYNNLATNPLQMLTANTRKRCEKSMDEMRLQLKIL